MLVLVPSVAELRALFPELASAAPASDPVEVPGVRAFDGTRVRVARCGVGPVESAARAAVLLVREGRPCVLVGLAGTLQPEKAAVGTVLLVTDAAQDGIGIGSGDGHRSLDAADGPLSDEPAAPRFEPWQLADSLELPVGRALSVTAASASPAEAARRLEAHPDCVVEDMETTSVLWAGLAARVPVAVLRAVSNVAGDRDHAGWRVADSLAAAREALLA